MGGGGLRNRCIMLIMTLDPSWRQTLRLPLPGIEPGSPASQAGTLPKELSRQLIPEFRIRDLYPRSLILIFSHPGSWIQNSNKREGWKKICCHNFLCSHKFHKIANYFSFEFFFFFLNIFLGDFYSFSYNIQHCFICRPSDSTVPTDAGIEPRTVATWALAVRRSNH